MCGANACKTTCAAHTDCVGGDFCWFGSCVQLTAVAAGGASVGAGGSDHSCAITSAGSVQCWGSNTHGQLGNASTTNSSVPVAVSGLSSGVTALAAGAAHTCAVTSGGGVQCWGWNEFGHLGNGSTADSYVPVAVSGLSSGVVALAATNSSTCALTTTGGVWCWGGYSASAGYGIAIGNNSTTGTLVPVAVSGLTTGVTAITAGSLHVCALTTTGGLQCWGDNGDGQLGDGSTTNRLAPVAVSGLSTGVTAVAAGSGYHTCAVTSAGAVLCWGANSAGELGDGTTMERHTPVNTTGLTSGIAAVTAGDGHTCARTTAGGVLCWGLNLYGQLGNNSTTDSPVSVAVSGLSTGVAAVSVRGDHSCALTTAGAVQCWGYNGDGELGNNSTTSSSTPVTVLEP